MMSRLFFEHARCSSLSNSGMNSVATPTDGQMVGQPRRRRPGCKIDERRPQTCTGGSEAIHGSRYNSSEAIHRLFSDAWGPAMANAERLTTTRIWWSAIGFCVLRREAMTGKTVLGHYLRASLYSWSQVGATVRALWSVTKNQACRLVCVVVFFRIPCS